ncbi:MAG: type II secretion system protein, partial [Planctomycetia bacterium]
MELLIAIAIVTAIGAVLLPAVQSAREASRLTGCRSNIAQLAKGMAEHETFHGYFPSGGWSLQWLGVAERSGDSSQPGGWAFGVLPYIEEVGVRNVVSNV